MTQGPTYAATPTRSATSPHTHAAMDPDATLPAPGPPADPEALMAGPERAARRLVLLHGWGADADDLLDLGQELVDATVSVVALRAPQAHPGGFGRQWYPLSPAPEWVQLPASAWSGWRPPCRWKEPPCWASPKGRRWPWMRPPTCLWRL